MKKVKLAFASTLVFALFIQLTPLQTEALEPLRQIKGTYCLDQSTGELTGLSNDCIRGDGSCIDGSCPGGTTESRTMSGNNQD